MKGKGNTTTNLVYFSCFMHGLDFYTAPYRMSYMNLTEIFHWQKYIHPSSVFEFSLYNDLCTFLNNQYIIINDNGLHI